MARKNKNKFVFKFARKIRNVFIEGILENRKDRSMNIIEDGRLNDFPQHLISIVEPAPYTRAALEKRGSFVVGKGLNDSDISKMPINPEYNFGEFHRRLSKDFNYSDRCAVWMSFSKSGKLLEFKHIPFEWVRYGVPNEQSSDVWYGSIDPYANTSDDSKAKHTYYPLYMGADSNIREDAEKITTKFPEQGYKGHLYFYNKPSARSRIYSRPAYFAAENTIFVDAGIWQFHERNLANNFFIGGIINKWGDPNEGILDEDGEQYTTVGEEYAKEVESIASGADSAGNFIINWFASEDGKADFIPWQSTQNHEMFIELQDRVREMISVSIGIPQILLGIPTAGSLGDVQQMRNAIKWTNENTHDWREKLEDIYKMLLDAMGVSYDEDFGINKIQDITDIPNHIFAALTPEQQGEFIQDEYNIERGEAIIEPEPIIISPNGSDN